MGGYEEDQLSELQALEAIYPDEITGEIVVISISRG